MRLVQVADFSLKGGEEPSLQSLAKGPDSLQRLVERTVLLCHEIS